MISGPSTSTRSNISRIASSRSWSGTAGFRQRVPNSDSCLRARRRRSSSGLSAWRIDVRAIQSPPSPTERLDGDLAGVELTLEPFSGSNEVRRGLGSAGGANADRIAPRTWRISDSARGRDRTARDLLLVALGPVGGRWPAGGSTGVPDTAVAVAGIAVEGALAVDAAHQSDQRVRASEDVMPGWRVRRSARISWTRSKRAGSTGP